jgi:hypothetical protein
MWLSANPKVYRFLLPYLPYTKRWNLCETDLNLIYEIGKYLGNTLMIISIIWSILNGVKLLRTKEIENGLIKSIWLLINLIPIILLLFGLIFQY